mmetsp:Transcript_8773/g.15086  ORF Transcript_8773/g.15086 Transcript_8773/m.15086 type:complete len:376 (-) Transcript_8773:313-1440(-)
MAGTRHTPKQSQNKTNNVLEKCQRQMADAMGKDCTLSSDVADHETAHEGADEKLEFGAGEQMATAAVTVDKSQHSCIESDSFSDDDGVRRGIRIPPDDDSDTADQTAEQSMTATTASCKTKNSCFDCDSFEEEETVRRGITFTPAGISKARKIVAIFADYDGCFDVISPSNPAGAKMDKMFDYAKQINRLLYPRRHAEKMLTDFLDKITADAGQVLLFSGSNRQSRKADESNAVQNDNGLAMTGLKGLAEDKGWQFKSILLEDAAKNPKEIMSVVGGSSEIKRMLAENNFTCLTGPTDVYFFDDIEKYLKYTRETANIPENIKLKTVNFDWYGICIEGTQDGNHPLVPISASKSSNDGNEGTPRNSTAVETARCA